MDSKDSITQQPKRQQQEWPGCRVRMINDTDLAECLMEVMRCQWAVHFGDERFCKHPSANQYAILNQP